MGAVLYLRVSTDMQARGRNADNLPAQQRICRDWCRESGLPVLQVFIDDGASGRTANRPQFKAMLAFCKKNRDNISHVVVQDISRLARNLGTQNEVITLLGKLNIVLVSASEPHIENVSAAGRFGGNVLGAAAQYQSDAASERIRARMKQAAQSGRFLHRAPIGYLNSSTNGTKNIAPDPERAPLVQKIFESMASGMPAESVRKQMTALGLRTRTGRTISQQGFAQLIRNPAYCGLIRTKQVEARGTFDALVTEELFQRVQDTLNGRRGARPTRHHKINAEFPLRGFLLCSKCGRPLTAGFPKGKYPTMWCWVTGCRGVTARREKLESDFVNLLHTMQPTVELVANLPKLAAGLWQARTERIALERKTQVQRLNDQSTLNSRAVAARVRGDISAEDFAALKADITKTTTDIQEQIKAFDSETSTLETMMVEAKTSVLDLPKHWTASDTAQKQELQRALFPDGLMVSKEKGYFERGNTSLMESWRLFFNSLEGSTTAESFENKFGRGERI